MKTGSKGRLKKINNDDLIKRIEEIGRNYQYLANENNDYDGAYGYIRGREDGYKKAIEDVMILLKDMLNQWGINKNHESNNSH